MKKLMLLLALTALFAGCKTKEVAVQFDCDVDRIAYHESKGADIIPGDVPIPTGITFKLWHMTKDDGTTYIGTKVEEKILWIIPLEYGQHVWQARPGEWDNPGDKMAKAYEWADLLDKQWSHKVDMKCIGSGANFRRKSDGYVESFGDDYKCWTPR